MLSVASNMLILKNVSMNKNENGIYPSIASVTFKKTVFGDITDGIESMLKPFSKIGFPSHELAMMMTIALRFISLVIGYL